MTEPTAVEVPAPPQTAPPEVVEPSVDPAPDLDPAGADPDLTNPDFDAPRVWAGLPVNCQTCGQAGVPVCTDDGWRLPLHPDPKTVGASCGGSLAAVVT